MPSEARGTISSPAANIDHLHSDSDELFIIALERENNAYAIAPLCIQKERLGPFQGKVFRTITGDHTDSGAFYIHPEFNHRELIKKLLKALFANQESWDLLQLLNFSSRNPLSSLLLALLHFFLRTRSNRGIASCS